MRGDTSARSRLRAALHRVAARTDGFTMIEVVVALVLLTLVAAATFTLFIRVASSSKGMDTRSAAITVAGQGMDQVRALIPSFDASGHSKLVAGRQKSLVIAQWAAAPSGVDLSQTYEDYDPNATSASIPVSPLTATVVLDQRTYQVTTYIGQCVLTKSTGECGLVGADTSSSDPPAAADLAAGQTLVNRVIVSVTWQESTCSGGICQYALTTLIDPTSNPEFTVYILKAGSDTAMTSSIDNVTIPVIGNDKGKFGMNAVFLTDTSTTGCPATIDGLTVVGSSAHGCLARLTDGSNSLRYQPKNPLWIGADSFTYRDRDTYGDYTNVATVTVNVTKPPAPTPVADWASTVAASGSATPITYSALPTGVRAAWDPAVNPVTSLTLVSQNPGSGGVTVTKSGTGAGATITVNRPAGYSGVVQVRYTLTDGFGQVSAPINATITVTPTVANVSATTAQNTAKAITLAGVGSSPRTYTKVAGPSNGTVTIAGNIATYTPKAGWPGGSSAKADSFTYTMTDGAGQVTGTATVTISVYPPPTAANVSGVGGQGRGIAVALNGTGSTALTYSLASGPTNGTVSVSGNTATYTSNPAWPGGTTSRTDTFTYRVTDTFGQTATATATVTVFPPPVATAKVTTCPIANKTTPFDMSSFGATWPDTTNPRSVSAWVGTVGGSSVSVSGLTVNFKTTGTAATSGKTLFTFQLTDRWGNSSGTAAVTC